MLPLLIEMFFPLMIAASHGLILETAGTIGDGLYNAILMSNSMAKSLPNAT